MKQIISNQLAVAVIAFLLLAGLAAVPLFNLFQGVKVANEKQREKLSVYQNLNIQDNQFLPGDEKISCEGNLLFQAQAPVIAMHVQDNQLTFSQADNKFRIMDLGTSSQIATFSASILTDIYRDFDDPYGIYGTDFFNDQVVRFTFKEGVFTEDKVYPKIGRVSALTRGPKGHFYASGYSSGNLTKIIGRDGFLFLTDLDKVTDLEADSNRLLVARFNSSPSLIAIDFNDKKQTVIEQNDSISSLVFDGNLFWVMHNRDGRSYISNVKNDKLSDSQVINCDFPLKVAVSSDKIFYTSLKDKEGKIYWINKNLQSSGR